MGLLAATSVGVGAIVGGGILALAGVAFSAAGPSAIVAFGLNGLIAFMTAMSFAELATRFPQSGGTYAFAKRVYSVEAAFTVGWVAWFASLVAAVLYALGFGAFVLVMIRELLPGEVPAWLEGRGAIRGCATAAVAAYLWTLIRSNRSGGQWAVAGKVVLFLVLVLAGGWTLMRTPADIVWSQLTPFWYGGKVGVLTAMGFSFIALQGFDLIATVGGEVRDPLRTLPRSMFLSLGLALVIYLPLLFVVCTVGVDPGVPIADAVRSDPESIIAAAAERFLGRFGLWLVLIAALLAMLSALRANLLAASRVALAMARDHTLPRSWARVSATRGTPVNALLVTGFMVVAIILFIPGVAAAGAAASLIFLITFALTHLTSMLVRRRAGPGLDAFRSPWFPAVPVTGMACCVGLAFFQGFAVPSAGLLSVVWAGLGGILYVVLFARKARVLDAGLEASDPDLALLRGKSPLVVVPIANPRNAPAMVEVADAIAAPAVGRVMLLFVVHIPRPEEPAATVRALVNAEAVLRRSLAASLQAGVTPEALTTLSYDPWEEIVRVARLHRCESLLLGFNRFATRMGGTDLEHLLSRVDCDVALLRAPPRWKVSQVQRVLVPLGGRSSHDVLRARLLGSLRRAGVCEIVFLRIVPEASSEDECLRAERDLSIFAREELSGRFSVRVSRAADPAESIVRESRDCGLVVLGLQRMGRRHKGFGSLIQQVARQTPCPLILISSRR